MGDPCHPSRAAAGVFMDSGSALHLSTSQQLCFPSTPRLHPEPQWDALRIPREKLLLTQQGQTEVMQTYMEMQQEGRGRGMKDSTAAHIKLRRENQVPPCSKSSLALSGSQSHAQQYSREPHSAALEAINSNIRIKKEVPDGGRFSDRQAASSTNTLSTDRHLPCPLLLPIPAFFYYHPFFFLFFAFPLVAF